MYMKLLAALIAVLGITTTAVAQPKISYIIPDLGTTRFEIGRAHV